jgi:hypothetical protein
LLRGHGALLPFGRVAEGLIVSGELDQHPCLLIAQLGRGLAEHRHVVEQAFRTREK